MEGDFRGCSGLFRGGFREVSNVNIKENNRKHEENKRNNYNFKQLIFKGIGGSVVTLVDFFGEKIIKLQNTVDS